MSFHAISGAQPGQGISSPHAHRTHMSSTCLASLGVSPAWNSYPHSLCSHFYLFPHQRSRIDSELSRLCAVPRRFLLPPVCLDPPKAGTVGWGWSKVERRSIWGSSLRLLDFQELDISRRKQCERGYCFYGQEVWKSSSVSWCEV